MKRLFFLFFLFFFNVITAFGQIETPKAYQKHLKKHRKTYRHELVHSPNAPLQKADLKKLDFYEADLRFKIRATFQRTENAKTFDMPTSSGIVKPYLQYGIATFIIENDTFSLAIYKSLLLARIPQYKDYLFLPFKDSTSGKTTYEGGRYLDLRLSDIIDNQLMIDFNKAYNPYCAFADGYACPIPPNENHLPIEIKAGEKKFKK